MHSPCNNKILWVAWYESVCTYVCICVGGVCVSVCICVSGVYVCVYLCE